MDVKSTTGDASGVTDWVDRETLHGYLFALPYVAVFSVFLLYPLVKGFYMSFFEWDLLQPAQSEFVGIENYVTLLSDPLFWKALKNTAWFVVLTVPSLLIVSMIIALGINRGIKGKKVLQFFYFVPYVMTVSIVGFLWLQLYASNGVFTVYLGRFVGGILTNQAFALPALSLLTVWWQAGFYFAVLLASRQNVPERLYEAAQLDGAGPWRQFWDITLPQMKNAIIFVLIAGTVFQFQVFGQVETMTSGGPNEATITLVYYLYQLGFKTFDLGYGAAVGYVILLILIGVSVLNYAIVGQGVDE
ncbi:carbohydrate ABC transporter membrane protein 1, CUT1 family [Halomicrobium zhouii]|uniref:Carbohydrate ABC transporter membrane protein 1, CUT1 family n=1 Tax=Halomicrobium zhouii TaxID=767519 RepID=A0A1I6L0T4_9EURY|nr:sugar ABC transporter permease [Halomicrobium zhouii]SFR97065.1 carbohydrate ABC transporter membrane protein 1, CUT1 family [Halomicrobium zhouii]